MEEAIVIGGGLAGSEAAYQLAQRGIAVRLYEMKPQKFSPAHHSEGLAELVCSNSFRSGQLENAVGLLKEELRRMDSLIMRCIDKTIVPAGGAVAVDRDLFSRTVTEAVQQHPNITLVREEVTSLPEQNAVVATGPLTSDALAEKIAALTGGQQLYFYDAAAPIVTLESIDFESAFRASRYGRGEADYINCPMNREEYEAFWEELVHAERAPRSEADREVVFEGCMPIETMARRGHDTMLFGPLKPVGLEDPRGGGQPYAVVQLRQDNREGTLYNIVGFQTHLKWGEQKRVFGMIPALKNAEFVRYGVMHRNTYINSPTLLDRTYRLKNGNGVYFAGQMTGVEGYIESTASGFVAGVNLARRLQGKEDVIFPRTTAIGALAHYISGGAVSKFQPMNVTFGIMDGLDKKVKKKRERNLQISLRALDVIETMKKGL